MAFFTYVYGTPTFPTCIIKIITYGTVCDKIKRESIKNINRLFSSLGNTFLQFYVLRERYKSLFSL